VREKGSADEKKQRTQNPRWAGGETATGAKVARGRMSSAISFFGGEKGGKRISQKAQIERKGVPSKGSMKKAY